MASFTNPDNNIAQLKLRGDERVAVFGSGAGGHTFAAMRVLRGGGKVIAIDVRQDMLDRLRRDSEHLRLGTVTTKCVDYQRVGGTGMQDGSLDAVVIPNTLFAVDHKVDMLKEAYRLVRPKGLVLIVDWKDSYGGMGPQEEHVVTLEQALAYSKEAGLDVDHQFSAGAQHYGIVCRKIH